MVSTQSLSPDQLYLSTDPAILDFETTDELPDLQDFLGQPRAIEAVSFGIGIDKTGYNIFALGPPGSGKRSLVNRFFERRAKDEPIPWDWCYVHNFEQEHKPRAIRLPAGMGIQFRDDMAQLVEELRSTLSAAFDSDEYRARRRTIEEEYQERQEKSFEEIQEKAKKNDLALLRTPAGVMFAPIRDGEVLPPEEFTKMSPEDRQRIEKTVEELQQELQNILVKFPTWQREIRERIRQLNHEITGFAVGGLLSELRDKYNNFPDVLAYLEAVEKDVIENARDFLQGDEAAGAESAENPIAALMARARQESTPLRRYQVNLLVDHHTSEGAPVVFEDNPTYQNLIGRVEHIAQMGALVTDFHLIKPGALHLANGGYLILDARKVLMQPYAWEALKRALQSRQIRIESLGQMLSLISTVSLEPEPVPLDVKIALIGDRLIYYLLSQLDPEFDELFMVQADFEEQIARDLDNQRLYAQLIASLVRKDELRPFHRSAVARVMEQSARLVGDAEKLSIRVKDIIDLVRESDYWAGQNGNSVVQDTDVQRAIDAQIFRADRIRERYQENIMRQTIMIDTSGEKAGQVNGLSVVQLGNFAFAIPSRITCRVHMGKGDVINIEREVELSGPIHSKGVLILAGFLSARFATEKPLSLSASLVFEQSYSGVEGDSASLAELCALLSALSESPIKQSLAVTGSVNQHGQIQSIGGVNQKIEGFFDICKARELTGDQGVLIPASNVKHLMLREDVVAAVSEGKFHIYPVEHIDQGIELLTGTPAGELDQEGKYPEETINGKVQKRLAELAKKKEESTKGDQEQVK